MNYRIEKEVPKENTTRNSKQIIENQKVLFENIFYILGDNYFRKTHEQCSYSLWFILKLMLHWKHEALSLITMKILLPCESWSSEIY